MHTDFQAAYEAADQTPGTPVHFEGSLPSGYLARQTIVAVPRGQDSGRLLAALKTEFGGARIIVSSSMERGTHIIGTHGALTPPQP